jgi:hypothetical protein
VNNFPYIALGKERALEGELSRICFPRCESWRLLEDSIIIVGVPRATTLKIPSLTILEP